MEIWIYIILGLWLASLLPLHLALSGLERAERDATERMRRALEDARRGL